MFPNLEAEQARKGCTLTSTCSVVYLPLKYILQQKQCPRRANGFMPFCALSAAKGMVITMEKLLTCEQIAERYSVKVITVWEWIRNKKLPAIKAAGGRVYRIRAEDLEAFEKQYQTTNGKV